MKKFLVVITLLGMISSLEAFEIRGTVTSTAGKLKDAVVYIERIEGRSFLAPKEPLVLSQRGLRFIPHVLPVLVGSIVNFPNEDDVLHNVFSPGFRSKFNLGSYPQKTTKSRKFDEPGIILLLCNIHHEMSAFIVVIETPFFAVTDQGGNYEIRGVPPGRYHLTCWHEIMKLQVKEVEIPDRSFPAIDFKMAK